MQTIGLLGGTTWLSTVEYYRRLNQMTQDKLGGAHSCRLLLHSFDFEELTVHQRAGDWKAIETMLIERANSLVSIGAESILICANTLHLCADAVAAKIEVPLVHLVDAIGEHLVAQNLRRVAVLGTRYTMEGEFYGGRLREKHGIDVLVPTGAEADFVHDSIFGEFARNEFLPATRDTYLSIMRGLARQGAEAIVMGCTEIPLLMEGVPFELPLIDTIRVHCEAAIAQAL